MKLVRLFNVLIARFDGLSLRERMLVIAAALALLVGAFHLSLMRSVDARRARLALELSTLQSSMSEATKAALAASAADPVGGQFRRVTELEARVAAADAALASQAAGVIPAERMMHVLNEVLSREHGVKLVSLRYLRTTPLPDDAPTSVAAAVPRPYLHTFEIVVQGSYFDILNYLRALEALPSHFYWRRLELTTRRYPTNEMRLEVGTVSMESAWIGI